MDVDDKLSQLQTKIGYSFKDAQLLKQALTHRSLSYKVNNEGLEFVGDSILGAAAADLLMMARPHSKESSLTFNKGKIVSNAKLAVLATGWELNELFQLINTKLDSFTGPKHDKRIADCVEALIAAIFIDSGRDYLQLRTLIDNWLQITQEYTQPPDNRTRKEKLKARQEKAKEKEEKRRKRKADFLKKGNEEKDPEEKEEKGEEEEGELDYIPLSGSSKKKIKI